MPATAGSGSLQTDTEFGVAPGSITYFIHGTTLAVNTIIQRRGLRNALLVTQGFRDILNIGRHRIPDVFTFFTDVPAPLVPRSRTFEIAERCLSDGTTYRPVDAAMVRDAARRMHADGVEAVAICFLHSYRNDANEVRAQEIATLVLNFLSHIEHQRSNVATTRNSRLGAIKAFMRYVEFRVPSALEQIRQIHAIPIKRHDQALVRHLTMDEVRAILDAPNLKTRLGIRDRAMLHLCFACGLRVSELVGHQLEQVSLHRPASVCVRGKGRKNRSLPLWKETTTDLRAWLAVRGIVRVPEVFVNAEGAAMTRAGFEYILDKRSHAGAAGCSGLAGRSVSPHQRTQLRGDDASGHPRHSQGGVMARPR
jgi:site-specific recombinase XerD